MKNGYRISNVSNFNKELWSSILVNNIDESFVEIKDFVMLNPSVSYEHLKRRLAHATFDNTGTANPLKVFCNRTQKERESVGKYANILLSWASKAKIREEEMRDRFRTQFLDGLRNAAVREHLSVFLMENRLAEIPEMIFMAEITERSFEQQCDLSEQGCEENTKSGEDGVYMATSWQPKNPLYRVSFQNETQPIGTPEPVYRAQKSYNTNQNHTNPPNPYRKPNQSNPPSQKQQPNSGHNYRHNQFNNKNEPSTKDQQKSSVATTSTGKHSTADNQTRPADIKGQASVSTV